MTAQDFPYILTQRTVTLDSVQLLLLSQREAAGAGPSSTPVDWA